MSQSLQSFVVSIRHQTHRTQIAGTGFVVDDRHILTCAHVITQAGAAPGDTVRVVFAVPREAGAISPAPRQSSCLTFGGTQRVMTLPFCS